MPTLLVFSDDWGRHPSSSQHLIRHLLPRYEVLWVNTIGMRRPGINYTTVARVVQKLQCCMTVSNGGDTRTRDGNRPKVIEPLMWPWFRRSHDRWINRRMLRRSLIGVLRRCSRPVVAITTIPVVADIVGELPVDRWVYYCVDDFSKWPGLDGATMGNMENCLIEKVDCVVACSSNLCDRLRLLGAEPSLLTHGVDNNHWSRDVRCGIKSIERYPKPYVVFWGLIDQRLDAAFVQHLSASLREGTIILAGPIQSPPDGVMNLGNVVHLPSIPYEALPALATSAAVLIMPYADVPVTRAMQPLKLKEYLATGKAVVVRHLPAVDEWSDCLDACSTAGEFAARVVERIASGPSPEQIIARTRLRSECWSEKAAQFEQLVLV